MVAIQVAKGPRRTQGQSLADAKGRSHGDEVPDSTIESSAPQAHSRPAELHSQIRLGAGFRFNAGISHEFGRDLKLGAGETVGVALQHIGRAHHPAQSSR